MPAEHKVMMIAARANGEHRRILINVKFELLVRGGGSITSWVVFFDLSEKEREYPQLLSLTMAALLSCITDLTWNDWPLPGVTDVCSQNLRCLRACQTAKGRQLALCNDRFLARGLTA